MLNECRELHVLNITCYQNNYQVIDEFVSLQVYAMPVFDLLERMSMKRFNIPPGITLRLIIRSAYVGKSIYTYVCIYIYVYIYNLNAALLPMSYSIYIVRWSDFPFLRGPTWLLWWFWLCPDFLFCKWYICMYVYPNVTYLPRSCTYQTVDFVVLFPYLPYTLT